MTAKTGFPVSLLVLGAAMIGCGKEEPAQRNATSRDFALINSYSPEISQIEGRILTAIQRRQEIENGSREEELEIPIDEAVWLSEALMNFEKGDALRRSPWWSTGSFTYTIPIITRSDGSLWMRESEFFRAHNDAMVRIEQEVPGHRIYLICQDVVALDQNSLTVKLEWCDADLTAAAPEGLLADGSNFGCLGAVQGAQAIKWLIHMNYHGEVLAPGSFIVSTHPPIYVDAVTEVPNPGNIYPRYMGTSDNHGGPHWIYSGPDAWNAICFPDRWNRYLAARQHTLDILNLPSSRYPVIEFFGAAYTPRTGQPFTYGSPIYPMGPWDHLWAFRIGYIHGPIGPE